MRVAGTGRSNDYGGDEGSLLGRGSIVRHIWESWESVKVGFSPEGLGMCLPFTGSGGLRKDVQQLSLRMVTVSRGTQLD